MTSIFWMYKGYCGDEFLSGAKSTNELLTERFVPAGKSNLARIFSWLSQKGFGHGYYNNSGVYVAFQRTTFRNADDAAKALAKLKDHYLVTVYETREAYMAAVENARNAQRQLRRAHPY